MKKRIYKLLLIVISAMLIFSLVSCSATEGPQGIQGEKGDKGDKGDKGPKGEKGDSAMELLKGKKIIYEGDSICEERHNGQAANGGAYSKKIAALTGSTYENFAVGGGTLASQINRPNLPWGGKHHSVVDTLAKLPTDADIYCFEGGINDYWQNIPMGSFDPYDYSSELDVNTVCGALEYIFRYSTENFDGSICFVITHKISEYNMTTGECTGHTYSKKNTAPTPYTFAELHESIVGICQKYAIPYYDAYNESGLTAWNPAINNTYLTAGGSCTPTQGDGCHPNSAAYDKFYVPQLISLFERIIPR